MLPWATGPGPTTTTTTSLVPLMPPLGPARPGLTLTRVGAWASQKWAEICPPIPQHIPRLLLVLRLL